ncbi:MAG: hypothetical protein IKM52_04710, partial [Clostridia bacterium]|nr:hypothetical protein [Clostridia bacterium]
NIQTQNMLLKILEEPPQATYFFLLCESSASLLPTVKSRAPVLKLQHFDEAQLEKHLTEISFTASQLSKSDRTAFSQLLQSADGSIGKALALLNEKDENGGEAYRKADLLIELLCGQEPPNQHGLLSFFKNAFAGREDGGAFFDELSKAFRDLLAVKKSRRRCRLLFFRDMETASERAYSLSVQSLCELIEQTMYFRTLLTDGNANLTLIKNTFADAVYRAV